MTALDRATTFETLARQIIWEVLRLLPVRRMPGRDTSGDASNLPDYNLYVD